MPSPNETFLCPHCGEPVKARAISCKSCGSDARSGWLGDDEVEAASTDLPETHLSDADYERFLKDLEHESPNSYAARRKMVFVLVLIGAVAALLLFQALR